ncbi:Arc family DNA-binding protein [Pseudomonas aeruginosa]
MRLTSPYAREALARGKAKLSGPASEIYCAANADKFQIRLPLALRSEIVELATRHNRTVNSEYNTAIISGLNGFEHEKRIICALSDQTLKQALSEGAEVTLLDIPSADMLNGKVMVRLPAGIREKIENLASVGEMNTWIVCQVTSWINYNRRLEALLAISPDR